MPDEPRTNTAVFKAESRGHRMEKSPRRVQEGVERHECTRCHAAAISYQGNTYGLALESDCPYGDRSAA